MRRWVFMVMLVAAGAGACERSRAVNEAGGQATRAVHARDQVQDRVKDEAWRDGPDADVGESSMGVPLTPLEGIPLALGAVEVLAAVDGMAIERQEWAFEGIRGVSYRVRVPLESARLQVLPSDAIRPLSAHLPELGGDFVAINGGFYDVDNTAMGLVLSGGTQASKLRRNGGSGVVESRGGDVRIVHRRDWEPGAEEGLQSIDRIVADGESLMTEGRRERHAARSAVAVGEDYLWFVVAIEEGSILGEGDDHSFQLQSTSFRGLPLWAFARYLLETTDVVDALNLDGAVSTQMKARVGTTVVDIRGEKGAINALLARPSSKSTD